LSTGGENGKKRTAQKIRWSGDSLMVLRVLETSRRGSGGFGGEEEKMGILLPRDFKW